MFFTSLGLMANWRLLRHLLLSRSIRLSMELQPHRSPRCKIPNAFIITTGWYDSASTGIRHKPVIRHKPDLNC